MPGRDGEIETFFLPVVYLCILNIDQVDRSKVMRCKKAYLVVNPRAGQNLAKITDVIAVLAAAGWKTTLGVKQNGEKAVEGEGEGTQKGSAVVRYEVT